MGGLLLRGQGATAPPMPGRAGARLLAQAGGAGMWLGVAVSSWDEWLAGLPAETAGRATDLRQRLVRAGCPDPDDWVRSEIDEGLPQAARYRFLRALWPEMIDSWRYGIDRLDVARPLLHQGVDRDDLVLVARAVAYETVFAMLYYL